MTFEDIPLDEESECEIMTTRKKKNMSMGNEIPYFLVYFTIVIINIIIFMLFKREDENLLGEEISSIISMGIYLFAY